jgi:ATP-dependent RNA helicase DDX52/ROK1
MHPFHILKDGTSFDRKRFANDIALFDESAPVKKIRSEIPEPTQADVRKEFAIHIDGADVPPPIRSFQDLISAYSLSSQTTNALLSNYERPTPVQMQVIPTILHHRDTLAIAPTGSGKTLSFALPIITKLGSHKNTRALVLGPTKELAKQLYREFVMMSQGTDLVIHNISKKSPESSTWETSFDIMISTPLLFIHKLGTVTLPGVEYVVMDEADQLFDMGYLEQVDSILRQCTKKDVCKMMFSATMLPTIEILARSMLINPVRVLVGHKNTTAETLEQELKFCTNETGKLIALRQLIGEGSLVPPVLIFVQSKERAKELFQELVHENVRAGMISSDLDTAQRDKVVKNFRLGYIWFLVCTDLMSRGIDFKGVNAVINYDFPQSVISYIHRVGRAGRAGRQAKAITFYSMDDSQYVRMIVNVMNRSGCPVPEWMLKLKAPTKSQKKNLEKKPPKRDKITRKPRLTKTMRNFIKRRKTRTQESTSQENES